MRLKEFQVYLKKEGIGLALLIHPDINITYFTQTKPTFAIFEVTPNSATLLISALDEKPHLKGITVSTLHKGWDKKWARHNVKKVGINKEVVTLAFWERLHKIFPKAKLVDISSKLKELKAQKTSEEIQKISTACKITDLAFNQLIKQWNPKKFDTEQKVASFLEKVMQEHRATPGFPTIVANGKNAAIPHYNTSNHKLRRGFLMLDFGACYQNYNADMSRTLMLGKPTKEEKERYELLQKVQSQLLDEVKEGILYSQLQQSAKKKLGQYSSHFIHLLGHGVGIDIHESPSFSLEAKDKIKNKHVFTIETGIYFYKKFGLRIEDTVLFDKKLKLLTTSPRGLIKLRI
mgnify:CR=1 FL=1